MCDAGGINFAWLYILFIFADGGSMKSFGSLEDLLVNELYEVGSAPERPDELPELQESELTEVSTADHHSEIPEITVGSASISNEQELTTESYNIEPGDQAEASPQDETIIDYDADSKSEDELNATVVAAQGAQPSVADAIGTVHIVHPNEELNLAVAETSDEVIEEQVPHANISPEAIVSEVEAVQVAVPVEPDGTYSIVSCPKYLHNA